MGRRPRYLYLPGTAGNYASTPDSAAVSVTGDIDLRVRVALDDWTPGSTMTLNGKYATGQRSYLFSVQAGGQLRLLISADGATTAATTLSSVIVGATDGAPIWVRATRRQSDGRVQFFISDDGATWTQLGSDGTSAAGTAIFDGTAEVRVGRWDSNEPLAGKVYRAQVFDGIDGTLVADFDPNHAAVGWTSLEAETGEVWTIHQSGAPRAEIRA